jgi:hypothetical protein
MLRSSWFSNCSQVPKSFLSHISESFFLKKTRKDQPLAWSSQPHSQKSQNLFCAFWVPGRPLHSWGYWWSHSNGHRATCVVLCCFFCVLVFFCDTRFCSQVFTLAKLSLYCFSRSISPLLCCVFSELGSHKLFAQEASNHDPPDLHLLSSQDYMCEPLWLVSGQRPPPPKLE